MSAAINPEHAARLELPRGMVVARYIDGMREVAAYDITRDTYLIRHDWIGDDGQQRTYFPDAAPRVSKEQLDAVILDRRTKAASERDWRNETRRSGA